MNISESMPEPELSNENPNLEVDPTFAALLGMLDGSSGTSDPLALLKTQLETQAQTNPQAVLIMKFLERRQQQQLQNVLNEEENEHELSEAEYEEVEDKPLGDFLISQQIMDQTHSELESLRVRNDTLALALGACYLCFGEDLSCENCHGSGAPGSSPPQVEAFRKYILPAVRRAQAIENKQKGLDPTFNGGIASTG
jgi:hypothetical protein